MNKGINMYVIQSNNKFFHFTGYGSITSHTSLAKASVFKTLKEARARADKVVRSFESEVKYYETTMRMLTNRLADNEQQLAKARAKLATLQFKPLKEVETQANQLKRTIKTLEDKINDTKVLLKQTTQDLNRNKSMDKPVVLQVLLQAA